MRHHKLTPPAYFTHFVGAAALLIGCGDDPAGGGLSGAAGGASEGESITSVSGDDGATEGAGSISDSGADETGGSASDSASGTGGDGGESEGNGGECPPGQPLCGVPADEQAPVEVPDGLPGPLPGVYDDPVTADEDQEFRALIGFPVRDREALEQRLMAASDPGQAGFGGYLGVPALMSQHAPEVEDFELVKTWLQTRGFTVDFTASNRLLIQFGGTVGQFNATFGATLLVCMRENPRAGLPPFPVYCTDDKTLTLPKFVADRTNGIVTADLPAAVGSLPGEKGDIVDDTPDAAGLHPSVVADVYGFTPLYEAGFTGQGVKLGVIAAATYHDKDLQTFWRSFGVERELPVVFELMEPVITRLTETGIDVQWASALAPGAEIHVYEGPDARNTSLLYTFNEAVARAEVDVLTDSFDHREDAEPKALRDQYDEAALMAAALGITVVGASGNSARPDIPCSSPHVTCVGGTELVLDGDEVVDERAWPMSGSGDTRTFVRPYWQDGVVSGSKRAVCDLALNASEETPYWTRRFGDWELTNGTSVGAPVFAAMIAVIDSARAAEGKPRVGFFNPTLYLDAGVRATFRDIVDGETKYHAAGTGWDYPTGWGAPAADKLRAALP